MVDSVGRKDNTKEDRNAIARDISCSTVASKIETIDDETKERINWSDSSL